VSSNERKERKPSKLGTWWRETIGELRRVSWPTPREAWRLTVIVIIVMVAFGVFLGVMDAIFSRLVSLIV
jgi:preprotein translocase subunit SecE